jgi:low affinity Fe/Cu permease
MVSARTGLFERFARATELVIGSKWAFITAVLGISLWGASGPIFGFSDTWQLVCNTATTIITTLVVFLIQHTQTKDTISMHLKIDELIRVTGAANNKLIGAQNFSDSELSEATRELKQQVEGS